MPHVLNDIKEQCVFAPKNTGFAPKNNEKTGVFGKLLLQDSIMEGLAKVSAWYNIRNFRRNSKSRSSKRTSDSIIEKHPWR